MITKETEDFFEKMLTEEEEITEAYLDAFAEWDKALFKIQLPAIISSHKKTPVVKTLNKDQQKVR